MKLLTLHTINIAEAKAAERVQIQHVGSYNIHYVIPIGTFQEKYGVIRQKGRYHDTNVPPNAYAMIFKSSELHKSSIPKGMKNRADHFVFRVNPWGRSYRSEGFYFKGRLWGRLTASEIYSGGDVQRGAALTRIIDGTKRLIYFVIPLDIERGMKAEILRQLKGGRDETDPLTRLIYNEKKIVLDILNRKLKLVPNSPKPGLAFSRIDGKNGQWWPEPDDIDLTMAFGDEPLPDEDEFSNRTNQNYVDDPLLGIVEIMYSYLIVNRKFELSDLRERGVKLGNQGVPSIVLKITVSFTSDGWDICNTDWHYFHRH